MKKNNKKGFTIVELVIVIAVIAILTAVLIPTFTSATEKAKESAAMQAARNEYELYLVEKANEMTGDEDFYIKSGDYWFEVEDAQFKSAKITAPASHAAKDLSEETVVKSFEKTSSNTAPASVDGKYYTSDVINNDNLATTPLADGTYYYNAYVMDGQNPDVAIYKKA